MLPIEFFYIPLVIESSKNAIFYFSFVTQKCHSYWHPHTKKYDMKFLTAKPNVDEI